MTFIGDLLGKIFPDKRSNFTHKENFTQTPEEMAEIRDWVNSPEGRKAFHQVHKTYHLKKAGIKDLPEVHILSSPYANGFAITFEPPLNKEIFSKLFFAFGMRMLDLGYYRVSLDRRYQETEDLLKTTEKQYYKPDIHAGISSKIDQRFGNVSIEKVMVNNQPSFLKVLVTVYSDRLYLDAKPFDLFVEELFEHDRP